MDFFQAITIARCRLLILQIDMDLFAWHRSLKRMENLGDGNVPR